MAALSTTSTSDHATMIIYYIHNNKPILLVGKESKYISDLLDEQSSTYRELLVKETYTTTEQSMERISDEFSKRADMLEQGDIGRMLREQGANPVVKFDYIRKNGNTYSVKYRYFKDSKRTFIKGSCEAGEDSQECINRELAEELGIRLDKPSRLTKIDSRETCVFIYRLDSHGEAGPDGINKVIKSRNKKRKGEIFDLKFVDMDTVIQQMEKKEREFNRKSYVAFNVFKQHLAELRTTTNRPPSRTRSGSKNRPINNRAAESRESRNNKGASTRGGKRKTHKRKN